MDLDYDHMTNLIKQAQSASIETLKLPLPRRFAMDVPQDYIQSYLGNMQIVIDEFLKEHMPSANIAHALMHETGYGNQIAERGISRPALEQMLQMRRFQLDHAPIFTLRESLCRRMDDMDIGSKVPMQFMRPPFPVCFFEFGPAESRGSLDYQVVTKHGSFILEGAYVSFYENADQSLLSPEGRDHLGVARNLPMRVLEITFSGSPASLDEKHRSLLSDNGSYMSLFWCDDEQSIEETLDKHFSLMRARGQMEEGIEDNLRENTQRLAKAMLYLMTDAREQHREEPEKELSRRLDAVKNPAKARKVRKQLDRVYDRVVIGPNRPYVPLSERVANIEHRFGVRPHFRRAHWSSRWSGPKKSVLKPVKIDLALVNAAGLSDDDLVALKKDYDVK